MPAFPKKWLFVLLALGVLVPLLNPLLPDLVSTPHASGVNRLYEPIGYWNGLGELAAIGIVLSLGLVAQASVPGRMVAAAGIVPLSGTLYLTFSRGAVLAVIVGVAVAAAFEANRLEWIIRALVLAPAALVSVVVLHSFPALTTAFPPHSAEVRQGGLALIVLGLVVLASVALAYRWAAVINRCLRSDRARRNAARGLVTAAVLAGVLVVAAAGGPKTFVNALGTSGQSAPRFKHGDLNLRLLSLSPNARGKRPGSSRTNAPSSTCARSGAATASAASPTLVAARKTRGERPARLMLTSGARGACGECVLRAAG